MKLMRRIALFIALAVACLVILAVMRHGATTAVSTAPASPHAASSNGLATAAGSVASSAVDLAASAAKLLIQFVLWLAAKG
jgi:hypothetical protein